MQHPVRAGDKPAAPVPSAQMEMPVKPPVSNPSELPAPAVPAVAAAKERHYRIHFGATGFTYETIFGEYLIGADEIVVEDPYLRAHHQILNFLRFCETAIRIHRPKKIQLVTRFDNDLEKDEAMGKFATITESLKQYDVQLEVQTNSKLHDREVRLSSGWVIKIGRGFDIYQKPDDWLTVGANDLALRPCLETTVDTFPSKAIANISTGNLAMISEHQDGKSAHSAAQINPATLGKNG
jgi:ATP-dependent Lon protease